MNRSFVMTAALGIALLVVDAHATEENTVVVYQPIWTENEIEVSPVTYIRMLGSAWPGVAVSMTCDSNAVIREGFPRPINRNAANMYGLRVQVLEGDWSHGFDTPIDTIHVVLDFSHFNPRATYIDSVEVAAGTVECILTNAALGHPPARNVDLRIVGGSEHLKYQHVYSLGRLGWLPRRLSRFWGTSSAPDVGKARIEQPSRR